MFFVATALDEVHSDGHFQKLLLTACRDVAVVVVVVVVVDVVEVGIVHFLDPNCIHFIDKHLV